MDDSTAEEELAAANLFNEEPGEGGKNGVDDHVDTADEESHVVILVQVLLKEQGQVVDDRVAAAELLEDLRRGTDEHTTQVLAGTAGGEVAEPSLLAEGSRRTEGLEDELLLDLSLPVADFASGQGGEDILSLFDAVLGDQVSGGVGKVPHADDDDDTKEDLEGDGETPDQVRGTIVGTEIDPVGDGSTDGDDTTFNTDQKSTVVRLGTLGLVGGDRGTAVPMIS